MNVVPRSTINTNVGTVTLPTELRGRTEKVVVP